MKKIMILTALICTSLFANADVVYRVTTRRCPPPPHNCPGYYYTTPAWANICAAHAAAAYGVGTIAYATDNANYVVVPPAPTRVPFMYDSADGQLVYPQNAHVVYPQAVGPVYTVQQPGTVVVRQPQTTSTTVIVPPPRQPRTLVGVNVLGLQVGVGY